MLVTTPMMSTSTKTTEIKSIILCKMVVENSTVFLWVPVDHSLLPFITNFIQFMNQNMPKVILDFYYRRLYVLIKYFMIVVGMRSRRRTRTPYNCRASPPSMQRTQNCRRVLHDAVVQVVRHLLRCHVPLFILPVL